MKKNIKKYTKTIVLICTLIIGVVSCSNIEDYKEFAKGSEIYYTGKIDSLKVYSGKNRVQIEGLMVSDPKITEVRIYWNNITDSIVVPIERTEGVDTLSLIIDNLDENIYNFDVRTFDALENSSIPVYAIGKTYGEKYQNSLINRPVVSNEILGNKLTINYASMDLSSGVFATEVTYMNTDNNYQTILVDIDSSNVNIENFKTATEYSYRTLFLPDETCIDTFYTESVSFFIQAAPTEAPYFKNASYPYEKLEWDGNRWGTPAEWIHNQGALSHNGYGALDNEMFDLESGWGQPDITNGKVYQTMNLLPGTYIYTIDIKEGNYDENNDKAFFTVALGNELPNVDDVETSASTLTYEKINMSNGLSRNLVFTLTEDLTQISIGVQTTNSNGAGKYLKINSFTLNKLTDAPYFKNASYPFEKLEWDGTRWGTPAEWIHNQGALSHNGYGALDNQIFDLESGWGQPDITNGKVYQTMFLDSGSYTYTIKIKEGNYDENNDKAYFTVALGNELPDVDNVETSTSTVVFERINVTNGLTRNINFTLTEPGEVSIGVQTTNSNGAEKYLKINSFELLKH